MVTNPRDPSKKLVHSMQSGQAIVVMALMMVALLGFTALALDGGRYYTQRRTSQNASDMASLAGLYIYKSSATPNDQIALQEINRVAELNGIADTDGIPGNAVNGNVSAWWVDASGQYVNSDGSVTSGSTEPPPTTAQIVNDPTKTEPAKAAGIKVRTHIPYDAFIAGIIGQQHMMAQADAVAMLDVTTKKFPSITQSAWLGGSDCDNLTDKIAFNFFDLSNNTFQGDVYDDGSLGVGSYKGKTEFFGNLTVRTIVGTNPTLTGPGAVTYQPISPYTQNPYPNAKDANGNAFTNYTPPTNPVAAPQGFPPWSYVKINNVQTQVDASFFRPVSPTGYFYDLYVKYQPSGKLNKYFGGSPAPAPSAFFTYINGGSKAANTTGVANALAAGKTGIYFVEGDVTLDSTVTGVTIIATGRVDVTLHGNKLFWGTAGPLALNISVLAGGDLGMPARCASDSANAILDSTGSNQVAWDGIIYVPYGEAYFGGNWDANRSNPNGPIVAYSLNLGGNGPDGGSHPDNNQDFVLKPNTFVQPFPSIGLNN